MVSIRSFGFVLLFVLVLIGESTAHSQGTKGKLAADETGLEPARENLAKLVKEVYDAVPTAADAGNSKFGGRKMMLKWGLDRKAATEEGSDGEETAKISGNVRNALNNLQIRRSSQEKFKTQDENNLLKENFPSSAISEASRKRSVKLPSKHKLCFQNSQPVSDEGSSSNCFSGSQNLVPKESANSPQTLLEASKELMNFLNEDYIRPPPKTPIHN